MESSTVKKVITENRRVIVDIRVYDDNHCHKGCPYLCRHRSAIVECRLFDRILSRKYDDCIRLKICKDSQYVK